MTAVMAFLAVALAVAGLALLLPVPPPGAGRERGRGLLRVAALGAGLRGLTPPADVAARLDAAGRPGGIGPRELMAAKAVLAVAGGGAGVMAAAVAPGRLGALVAVLAPVAGFLLPDLWLTRAARARARAARRELPALLDLLRVTVEAGASVTEALRVVGAEGRGPLAGEWRAAGRRVTLGVALPDALAGMVRRLPLPELAALVAALDRARRHGTPLAQALAAQATDVRAALARHAREEAARAGPKIQLVVALLLVPSVLLLVAAALVSALLSSGSTVLPS